MSHQLTFADSEFSTKRRQTRKEIFLSRMEQILQIAAPVWLVGIGLMLLYELVRKRMGTLPLSIIGMAGLVITLWPRMVSGCPFFRFSFQI